ncbi:17568_t:CDS:2 [Dentiscutata erythropus]|uniref:17568_t:CDS:1 n=1 Tax=Dentiscutata erythropus TaxID=1348616 RepID=A0A9N9HIW9_9GLOM|nr:17568_t:CDS:2 [Dentiscutata erythropus]
MEKWTKKKSKELPMILFIDQIIESSEDLFTQWVHLFHIRTIGSFRRPCTSTPEKVEAMLTVTHITYAVLITLFIHTLIIRLTLIHHLWFSMSNIDSDSIHSIDFPPPVPPKDDIRPMVPPKDFPRTFISIIDPSSSSDLNSNETPSAPKATATMNNKRFSFPALGSLFTNRATTTDNDVPRISSRPDSMFSKISSWWSNLSRLKPRNTANVAPITIPSTSSSATSLIAPHITNDVDNIQSPKAKKPKNITDLFRRMNEHLIPEFSIPSRSQSIKRTSFGTFIEKLNRKFSFNSGSRSTRSSKNQSISSRTNPSKTDWSSSASTYHNGDVTKADGKQKQKMIVDGHDLTASTQTLCPDGSSISTTHSTAAESHNNEDENNEDISAEVLAPLRYNSSDDTIKGASGTSRHSRLLDIFTPKSSSQRGSTSSRVSRGSVVHTTNGVPNRHIRINSTIIKDPTSLDDTQRESYENRLSSQISPNAEIPYYTIDTEGEDSISGNDTTTEGQTMSPLRLFKKKFYQNFLSSNNQEMNSKNKVESTSAIVDRGNVPSSSHDTTSNKKPFSRKLWFAKSYDSEDPSAFQTRPDSLVANIKVTIPLKYARDAFSNPQLIDNKGPAILSNCRIAFIPINFFDGLHNIKELFLDQNSLRGLSEEILKLTKLEILDLSNNCISQFNPRLKFKKMKNLRRINLDNNVLSDITNICKIKTLRELRANNNFLGTLTMDISKLTKLRLLYLDNNQLENLPDSVGRLKSLCVLRLNNNNIERLPSSVCSLRQLKVLELKSNLLTQLPENIKELESLAKLDVSNNRLTSLPNDIVKCSKLTHLNASNNKLESIPPKFGQLYRLITLNLRQNQINNLPVDFGKLTNLSDLDLSYNELVVLPEGLGNLKKLTEIKVNNNPSLLAIPDTLQKLTQIKKIYLQHCNLSSLPFIMGETYNQLKYVNISYNLFDNIPNLQGMNNVTVFNISNNRIVDLTEKIDQLESLCELYVMNNKLTQIPKSIGNLKNLEILDVSENLLVELPLSIGDCQNLRELKLRGNSLEKLPATLRHLTNLDIFHIGQWPTTEFKVIHDETQQENLKLSPYQANIPQDVERTLLWRMHDSILKRLREIDSSDGTSVKSLKSSNESNASQYGGTHLLTPDLSPSSSSSRDDVILKMTVLKGVYDQIMKDMRYHDKETSNDDITEPSDSVRKKFPKFKDFKFLKIGDNK